MALNSSAGSTLQGVAGRVLLCLTNDACLLLLFVDMQRWKVCSVVDIWRPVTRSFKNVFCGKIWSRHSECHPGSGYSNFTIPLKYNKFAALCNSRFNLLTLYFTWLPAYATITHSLLHLTDSRRVCPTIGLYSKLANSPTLRDGW